MNQKEIEAAGAEEYAMWRSTKDRVNSIKEYMVANATTHLNRLDKVASAAKVGDMQPMQDMIMESVGGGVVGRIKKKAAKIANDLKIQRKYDPKKKAGKGKNGSPSQSILKYDVKTPAWSTGSKASKEPTNVKTYSKQEVDELNKALRNKKGPKPDYTPKADKAAVANNTDDVTQQLEFNKNIDVIEYFKPVKTKAQMAAAVNALKHRFSNYDKIIRGIGKNNYNKMQETIYGGLETGLAGKQMNQHSQWARELYVEKMRGLGVL